MNKPVSIATDQPEHADFQFYSNWRSEWRTFGMDITIAYLTQYARLGYKFRVCVKRATLDEAIRHLLSIQNQGT